MGSSKPITVIKQSILSVTVLIIVSNFFFLKKIDQVKSEILIIENNEFIQDKERLNYWMTKFESENLQSFHFDTINSKNNRDTTISYLIFNKNLTIHGFNECYYECVYNNLINVNNYNELYNKDYNKNRPNIYISLKNLITEKYNISIIEFEDLVKLVFRDWTTGNEMLSIENITIKDSECISCFDNYQTNYIINNIAINEFKDFIKIYTEDKSEIDIINNRVIREYKRRFSELTVTSSSFLRNKIKSKYSSVVTNSKTSNKFIGSHDGIGTVEYSFNKKSFSSLVFDNLVEDVYNEYYLTNSLYNGAQPYSYCYGKNKYCSPPSGFTECSFIDVQASSNSDVIVIIKKSNRVVSHAYIKAGNSYKFKVGNGNFQTFFYYGKGWSPGKFIKTTTCGEILGGFVSNESIDKSESEYLYNSSMSYTLFTVENGNFSPKTSSKKEAF